MLGVGDRLDVDVAGARRAGHGLRAGAHRRDHARRGRRRPAAGRPTSPTRSAALVLGVTRGRMRPLASRPHGRRRLPDRQPARRRADARCGCCPASRRRCARRGGRSASSARRRWSTRGSWRAARARRRRDRGRDGRRRAHRGGGGRAARRRGRARRAPRRARERLRPQARHPARPRARRAKLLETGAERRDRPQAERAAARDVSSASSRPGIDSDVNRIANETRLKLGTLVYTYGVLRALVSWRDARWELDDRRRAARVHRVLRGRGQLRRLRRRDVPRARSRRSRTACSTSS